MQVLHGEIPPYRINKRGVTANLAHFWPVTCNAIGGVQIFTNEELSSYQRY